MIPMRIVSECKIDMWDPIDIKRILSLSYLLRYRHFHCCLMVSVYCIDPVHIPMHRHISSCAFSGIPGIPWNPYGITRHTAETCCDSIAFHGMAWGTNEIHQHSMGFHRNVKGSHARGPLNCIEVCWIPAELRPFLWCLSYSAELFLCASTQCSC